MDNREMLRQGKYVETELRKMRKMQSSPNGMEKYEKKMAKRAKRWARVEKTNEKFDEISDNTALATLILMFFIPSAMFVAFVIFQRAWWVLIAAAITVLFVYLARWLDSL